MTGVLLVAPVCAGVTGGFADAARAARGGTGAVADGRRDLRPMLQRGRQEVHHGRDAAVRLRAYFFKRSIARPLGRSMFGSLDRSIMRSENRLFFAWVLMCNDPSIN